MGDHTRLAAAGPGQNQQRPVDVLDRFPLNVRERRQYCIPLRVPPLVHS